MMLSFVLILIVRKYCHLEKKMHYTRKNFTEFRTKYYTVRTDN